MDILHPGVPITPYETYLAKAAGEDVTLPDCPTSRREQYWAAIVDGAQAPDRPLSREEHYLAAIAHEGADVPAPTNAKEMYLAAIVAAINSAEASAPDAPTTREEVWLAAVLEAYLNSGTWLTGISPLALVNSLAKPLKSLTQYGKCVLRDPDVPEGWERVEYLRSSGDAYLNLGYKGGQNTKAKVRYRYHTASNATGSGRVFGSRITASSDAFAFGTSSGVVSATANKVFWCFDSQPFFVVDDPAFAIDQWIEVVLSATEHTINGVSYGDDYTPTAFETPSNLALFGFDNNGTMGVGYVDIDACQLWDGSTLLRDLIPVYDGTEYAMYDKVSGTFLHNAGTGAFTGGAAVTPSPEHPMDIWCNNGKLRFSANMANVNSDTALVGYYISSSGVVTADANNWIYRDYIPVKPSTTYTLSLSTPVYFVSISEYSAADESAFVVRDVGVTGENTSLTITTGATTNFVRFGTNIDRQPITQERVLAINWMLNPGGTAMGYQPYVEGGIYTDGTDEVLTVSATGETPQTVTDIPMLLSVGDYKDKVELVEGLKTGNCAVIVLTGDEDWLASGSNPYKLYVHLYSAIYGDAPTMAPLCTHFKPAATPTWNGIAPGECLWEKSNNRHDLDIYTDGISLNDFKVLLAAQYAAGTPVMVVVPQATTTEQTTPHALHSYKGTTIISAESNTDPVTLSAEYQTSGSPNRMILSTLLAEPVGDDVSDEDAERMIEIITGGSEG